MKRFILLAGILLAGYSAFAQNPTTKKDIKATLPEGIMTLDRWTGRLSINGMNIDKNSTYLYFTPEAEAMYKSGDSISTVGDILISVGAGFAAGYLIGGLASGNKNSKADGAVYGVCAGLVLVGLPLHIVGLNKINNAIADYNTRHGYAQNTPELTIGAQQYGMGIALKF